jgi:hypothetical protein
MTFAGEKRLDRVLTDTRLNQGDKTMNEDEAPFAKFVCDGRDIFVEVRGYGRIAQYEGRNKWCPLKPGWEVTSDDNETCIDHDGRRFPIWHGRAPGTELADADEVERLKLLAAEAAEDAAALRQLETVKDIADRLEAAFPGRKFGISTKDDFDTWEATSFPPGYNDRPQRANTSGESG